MNGLFKIVLWFYLKYNKLDRSGTDQTSIKGPVKIAYNKFVNNLAKQEDTTSSALCQFTCKTLNNPIYLEIWENDYPKNPNKILQEILLYYDIKLDNSNLIWNI